MKWIIDVKGLAQTEAEKQLKEWNSSFVLITNHRNYEFKAYNTKDRDEWVRAFGKLITYKREVLKIRDINFDEILYSLKENHWRFDLIDSDFDELGFIKELKDISPLHCNNSFQIINSTDNKDEKKDNDSFDNTSIKLEPIIPKTKDDRILKKILKIQRK